MASPMVSYAQNFEDVMLKRAFLGLDDGFYVDVGAWDPDVDSVTRHFYDRGWRGVNIEPHPGYAQKLRAARTRDINLELAVGAQERRAAMTLIHGTGMSTFDRAIAAEHAGLGFRQEEVEVAVRTLDSVFAEHARREVHFLKVDCEGAEAEVINAFDLARFRPWVILVEATRPRTTEESHADWEPHILASDYRFAYFDGLNRFYVASERSSLMKHFLTPPNIFDDFVSARMIAAGLPDPAPAARESAGVREWLSAALRSLHRSREAGIA